MLRLSPLAVVLAAMIAALASGSRLMAAEQPNVVIVLVDDFGWGDPRRTGSWSGVSLHCEFCWVKVFRLSGQEAP